MYCADTVSVLSGVVWRFIDFEMKTVAYLDAGGIRAPL